MRRAVLLATVLAVLLVASVVALPFLGGSSPFAEGEAAGGESEPQRTAVAESQAQADPTIDDSFEPVATAGATAQESPTEEHEEAIADGVDEGIDLVQAQGVEVTQEQRAAAIEGAGASVAQHQEATVEQVQAATTGAVHGSLIQEQRVDVEQVQHAVNGAVDGGLEQRQTVSASQLQSATWGATHGALAQEQRATVEQIQVAARGAAAGAASEAGERDVERLPVIQEAAQGSAYGVLEQYQQLTVEQRQRVTSEHVHHAAAGAAAGALEGSSPEVFERELEVGQEQRVEIEQHQRVTIKQVQKAAAGAAKGALVQRQTVTIEQTQAAAHGAAKGSLLQVQSVRIEQVQRITITQVQEAAFGAATGAISRSQEATVEQIQAAATGGSQGALVQQQEVSITQIQHAALGASKGAVESAIQRQVVEVEQIQAAARGAGEGAVVQKQVVDVVQVQKLAEGASGGSLAQHQTATVTQIQTAAKGACQETARVVQRQRISVTQLQVLTRESASDAAAFAVEEDTEDERAIVQHLEVEVEQRIEEVDELEGDAQLAFSDQEVDGETVVVESADLSEGGFVAIHDEGFFADEPAESVRGVSAYLEPGEHETVEIDLEEPLEADRQLIAVAHLDTNGNEAFDYADTDGEEDAPYAGAGGVPVVDQALVTLETADEPEANLSVADQTGDGETLLVDEASATVEYAVAAEYDGERVESESFEANETIEGLELELDPPIDDEETTVEVAIVDADGEVLTSETVEYTLEDEAPEPDPEPEPEANLSVSDQTGDGETLLVDEASASVGYALTVTDENGEQLAETESFESDETLEDVELELDPPIAENATLEVSVVETDGTDLASETIEYAVEDEEPEPEPEPEPEATLSIADQTDTGETLIVDGANATVEYAIAVTDEDGDRLAETGPFEANEAIENEPIELDPPLEENATLEVAVVDADGKVLTSESIEYAVDEDLEFDVEFVDCTRAEVTGSFDDGDSILVATSFYESAGIGNTIGEYGIAVGEDVEAPLEGTVVFEVGEEFEVSETDDGAFVEVPPGDFGAAIVGVSSPDAIGGEVDHPNPDGAACVAEVRPELPELEVVETTPTDDAIEVTFGYENPNDAPLVVGSEFVEGTTADEPATELEPGAETFSVEWTPEDDDERLVWAVDTSHYDYDEPLVVETPTAGEIAPSEPAAFAVSLTGTNAPVERGEPLAVDAVVENVGGDAGTQEIELVVSGAIGDSASVSLEPDESASVTLTADTTTLEPGAYEVSVVSENAIAETTVTIEAPPDLPADEPTEVPTDEPIDEPTDDPIDGPVDESPADAAPAPANGNGTGAA